jgi:hypothetical protein
MKVRIAIMGVLLATTACSTAQDAGKQPEVASLSTTSDPSATPSVPGSAAPAPVNAAERPRLRLDMTDQDKQDTYRQYTKCMSDHGVQILAQRTGAAPKADQATADKAAKECNSLLPLPPWEEDATNPEAMDFAKKVVDCLRAKGVKKVEVSTNEGIVGPSLGGPENDQASIDKGMKLTPVCEKEVAGLK